jgi:chromosomal replication initiation ATPase DnaA
MFVVSAHNTNKGIMQRQAVNQHSKFCRDTLAEAREIKAEAEEIMAKAYRHLKWAEAEAIRVVDAARKQAAVIANVETSARPDPAHIIKAIALKHVLSVGTMVGQRRDRLVLKARNEAIAMIYRKRPDLSLTQIGQYFNRDHSSIVHVVKAEGVWRGVEGTSIIEASLRAREAREAFKAGGRAKDAE